MNTETVIVIGNGFDLDLGWDTSYKSFYEKHDGWKMHRRDEDDLFQSTTAVEKICYDYGSTTSVRSVRTVSFKAPN